MPQSNTKDAKKLILADFNEYNLREVKACEERIVLEGNNFFYKVHIFEKDNTLYDFFLLVLQAYAQEYKALGLDWEITTASDKDHQYIIEKREKITVCDPQHHSFADILKKSAHIKHKVEKKLQFPYVMSEISQLKKNESVARPVLARDCKSDISDYGVFKGKVIQLGNSGMFISLTANAGKDVTFMPFESLLLKLDYGNFYFAPHVINETIGSATSNIYGIEYKWWLFSQKKKNLEVTLQKYKVETVAAFEKNIEILSSKRL